MGRRKKTAEDWVAEFPDMEVGKKAKDGAASGTESTVVCKYCFLSLSVDPAKKPYDRIREHIASQRHATLKKASKQPTVEAVLVRHREQEKVSKGAIYDFVRALCFSGLSLEHADGELGDFVKQYCPAARTLPSAKHLRDKHLKEIFDRQVEVLKRKMAGAKVSIIVDESPDITGTPTVNTLFSYYDAETKSKAVHLVDVSQVKTCNSVSISKVLSSVLERYDKSWRDVPALASDSAEYMKKAVRDICDSENVSILHVKDLPHLIHVAVNSALSHECVADVRSVVIKFGALFKHANQLYQSYIDTCLSNGLAVSDIKKPPSVVPVRWYSFYKTLEVVTEMWDCLIQLVEKQHVNAKVADLSSLLSNRAVVFAKAISVQEVLRELVVVQEKLESGRVLLPEYSDLVQRNLAVYMEKVSTGSAPSPGGLQKTVMSMLPKCDATEVKDCVVQFCNALVTKWQATCKRNLALGGRNQISQADLWKQAKVLNPHVKHVMSKDFETYADMFSLTATNLSDIEKEFQMYMMEDQPGNSALDPLSYWANNTYYPHLKQAAVALLCMPNGSCDVERSFSKLRYVQRPERSRMSSDTLKMSAMLFVNRCLE